MHIVETDALVAAAPQLESRQEISERFGCEIVWLKSADQIFDFEIAVDRYAIDGNRPALSRGLIALGLPSSQIRWHIARPGFAMMASSLEEACPRARRRIVDMQALVWTNRRDQGANKMTVASTEIVAPNLTKVRAGFYRVGAYCIHKGHRWCVYHDDTSLPDARFRTLEEAAWWARDHQPAPI